MDSERGRVRLMREFLRIKIFPSTRASAVNHYYELNMILGTVRRITNFLRLLG